MSTSKPTEIQVFSSGPDLPPLPPPDPRSNGKRPPTQEELERERRHELASWALPFLQDDVALIELIWRNLYRLARPKERPLQTPAVRDHLVLALFHVEEAKAELRVLEANARALHERTAGGAL